MWGVCLSFKGRALSPRGKGALTCSMVFTEGFNVREVDGGSGSRVNTGLSCSTRISAATTSVSSSTKPAAGSSTAAMGEKSHLR